MNASITEEILRESRRIGKDPLSVALGDSYTVGRWAVK